MVIYIYLEKIGILASTGCRRYEAMLEENDINCQNQPKITGKIRPIRKDNFLVAVFFEFFSRYDMYILLKWYSTCFSQQKGKVGQIGLWTPRRR